MPTPTNSGYNTYPYNSHTSGSTNFTAEPPPNYDSVMNKEISKK